MSNDIRKFSVTPTGRLHLRDAADELMYADDEQTKPIAVNVYGPGSKLYAKAQAARQNRMMDKFKRKGQAAQTAEQIAKESAEFLTDVTASFENLEYDALTGDALATAVYSDITIGFVADQVAKYVGDWSNFSSGSVTS